MLLSFYNGCVNHTFDKISHEFTKLSSTLCLRQESVLKSKSLLHAQGTGAQLSPLMSKEHRCHPHLNQPFSTSLAETLSCQLLVKWWQPNLLRSQDTNIFLCVPQEGKFATEGSDALQIAPLGLGSQGDNWQACPALQKL